MAEQLSSTVVANGTAPQAVTVAQFADGAVVEVVTYVHENELQVTISTSRGHGTTVTVDDVDVYRAG
ncbi:MULTISPECIES: hypothetical protein [Mycobacterium]|uniref:Uncharacterized protein n=2 Tax=Mycobacterium TaxID=1763 RepID=A0AAW5S9S2_MYCBC|nr:MULTISPECIES: hypothetical protein [Mycobacterium]MBZ4631672.1 hypothetical protein [Mycobacterium avium subsp. hominissuis]MCV6991848.1 hypothetical protein [Mycobacterium bouchedurhonense]MCV6993669.1 hypothetical protein [Mycobacterium timonense]ORA45751.1 hypothetical protein BST19_19835 [Mycobacterium bouchedurhonense]ORW04922.1 hypothetical protein AWC14_02215 [Mycobacterium kyorinense]